MSVQGNLVILLERSWRLRKSLRLEVGVNDGEDPPVPIPNTVVKLAGAENT